MINETIWISCTAVDTSTVYELNRMYPHSFWNLLVLMEKVHDIEAAMKF